MASETVDPIDWSHPPPSWAAPPELLVHSKNLCSFSSTENRPSNLQHARQSPCLCGHSGCADDPPLRHIGAVPGVLTVLLYQRIGAVPGMLTVLLYQRIGAVPGVRTVLLYQRIGAVPGVRTALLLPTYWCCSWCADGHPLPTYWCCPWCADGPPLPTCAIERGCCQKTYIIILNNL